MKLTKEEKQKKLEQKRQEYYSLKYELYGVQDKLISIKKNRGHSLEFRALDNAVGLMINKIESDFNRYERRIRISDNTEDLKLLQQSLNREKQKNALLEKKIEEAKTSSGLFIDFVREKLGI